MGGWIPGGMIARIDCDMAVTWAIAESTLTFGWK